MYYENVVLCLKFVNGSPYAYEIFKILYGNMVTDYRNVFRSMEKVVNKIGKVITKEMKKSEGDFLRSVFTKAPIMQRRICQLYSSYRADNNIEPLHKA